MDIFKKVFNGDERLVITFWVWGFLGSIVYNAIVWFAFGFAGLMVVGLLRLLYGVFIWVSIWRSSDKYKGPSHWALIAKILVILGVIGTISGFFYTPPYMM